MKKVSEGLPLIFDVTHALQCRDPMGAASGGRRQQVAELGRAGIAVGIAGLFLEAHPNPQKALWGWPKRTATGQAGAVPGPDESL